MALRARRTCWRRTSGRSFVGREAFELTEAFEPNEEESAAVMWMFAVALAGNGYPEQAPALDPSRRAGNRGEPPSSPAVKAK